MSREKLAVTCRKCAQRNELGRVFCSSCGFRLPAQGISAQDVRRQARLTRLGGGVQRAAAQLLLVAAGMIVVSGLWPRREPFATGAEQDAQQFRDEMRVFVKAIESAPASVRLSRTVRQAGINAYVQQAVVENEPERRLSVRLSPEGLRARLVRPLWRLAFRAWIWQPQLSFETAFAPDAAGRLHADTSWVGHLPLPGMLGKPVAHYWRRMLAERAEWDVLSQIRCEAFGEGTLTLTLERSGERINK